MITPKIGGIILIILPLIPVMFAILTTLDERRKIQEIIFVVAAVTCTFFSLQYVKLVAINKESFGGNNFLDVSFQFFFSSYMFPSIYFCGLLFVYFGVYRRKIWQYHNVNQ